MEATQRKRVTLATVAARAGVSPSAVSIALSRRSTTATLKPTTRQRILDAVRDLNYQPDFRARGLARNQSFLMAMLSRRTFDDWIIGVSSGIESELRTHSYSLLQYIHGIYGRDLVDVDHVAKEARHLDLCLARGADGMLVMPALDPATGRTNADRFLALQSEGMPIVQIFGKVLPGVATVRLDHARAVALLLEHLWGLGHRKILHLTHVGTEPGMDPHNAYTDARHIRRAFVEQMIAAGLEPQIVACPLPSRQEVGYLELGQAFAGELAAMPDRPTAVITFGDYLAMGLMGGLHDAGVRIPGDVSIAGINNVKAAEAVHPSLTTIAFPHEEIGREAARLLFLPAEERLGADILIPPTLKPRRSTGPPPSGTRSAS